MYPLLRRALFTLPAEAAHNLGMRGLDAAYCSPLNPFAKNYDLPTQIMGLTVANPVGLAAGLDKDAAHIDALAALGFGFIEVGTVTPKAQPGNPKPRMFRLPKGQAIINRMGFNNHGVDNLVRNVKNSRYDGVLGINIGKNKDTSADNAVDDYLLCLNRVYEHASYVTVNLSSPNTPGLRDLQFGEPLKILLEQIKASQQVLANKHDKHVPIAVKLAPDMADEDLIEVAKTIASYEFEGIIATNTTVDKSSIQHLPHSDEQGGLSGAPLTEKAQNVMRLLAEALPATVCLIGAGGIMNGEQALDRVSAGASAVQLYTGFIYEGPSLIGDSVAAIKSSP